jgi:hypothetical protein
MRTLHAPRPLRTLTIPAGRRPGTRLAARWALAAGAAVAAVLLLARAEAGGRKFDFNTTSLPDGRLRIEVFSTDGRPAKKADVTVRTADGLEVARGATDADGIFLLLPPPGADVDVEVKQEGGHHANRKVHARGGRKEAAPPGQIPYGKFALGGLMALTLAVFFWWALRLRRRSSSPAGRPGPEAGQGARDPHGN